MTEVNRKKYRTGVVLSGGGARGFAHLGVLRALNEAGIYPEIISGTSAGALVGVLYADGYSPDEILLMMNASSTLHYVRPTVPREGLLQISGIEKILQDNLRARKFENLKRPLFVTATDLNRGRAVYFSEGELLRPVIASASIPVLFKPVIIDNTTYVDGGVMDNLPVKPIEDLCQFLVGSYVNPVGREETVTSLVQIAERAFMLNMSKELDHKIHKFDLFIAPQELKNYKILDPEKAVEVFEIGYKETRRKLSDPGNQKTIEAMLNKEKSTP
ncbi:MAG TPA: patatin-like phospholipase family protein [Bacteroidales bacterium]|jgi:NTE family protein|nr:patatin-like phospholipase family protein [Bacteroidales bacterium]